MPLESLFVFFLAPLGLRGCVQAFSGCGKRGILSSWGALASHCGGFFCCRTQALGCMNSVVVAAHRLRSPKTCGIFPDQGLNLCPLHWQVDSKPLDHQESPICVYFMTVIHVIWSYREILIFYQDWKVGVPWPNGFIHKNSILWPA